MKELSIEEKYNDLLTRLKAMADAQPEVTKAAIESQFPELKESEDERIRKEMLQIAKESEDSFYMVMTPNKGERLIAWLEKQGEHARFIEAIQVGDQVTKNEDGVLVNLSQLKRVAKKQGEQQPADKVEPKFKVGDIIRLKGSAAEYTIKKVTDTTYYTNGWSCGIEKCEEDYELVEQKSAWSEEDKCMLNNVIDTLKPLSQTTHSGYSINSMINWLKSLKYRVLPQQEWSEEDNRHIKWCIEWLDSAKMINNAPLDVENIKEQISWLKSLRPQTTWKPSDEQMDALKSSAYCQDKKMSKVLFELYQDLLKLKE